MTEVSLSCDVAQAGVCCAVDVMSPVCPQPVPASTDNVTTVQSQTAAVKWTPVRRVTPVGSVTVERRPAALPLSSVTLTPTAISAREQPGEHTCMLRYLNDVSDGPRPLHARPHPVSAVFQVCV